MDNSTCVLVSDFTIGGLAPFLAATADGPALKSIVAPFGQAARTLLDPTLECWGVSAGIAVVWTRPQSVIPSFGHLLDGESVALDQVLTEVDEFAECLRVAGKRTRAVLVPTWTLPSYDRGRGILNFDVSNGPAYYLLRMNARLAEAIGVAPGIHLLDAARWMAQVGPLACNPKLWHLGKIAFGPEVFKHAATDIRAAVRALTGVPRKLIALDLDDTLWGGVVGDVGWENLNLGGHEPAGEAFRAFQRALKALTRRGIVLGIVSKNTESVALEALDRHPEMLLRRDDFAAWKINWCDKAANLAEMAQEMNLGLDAVVFIDDNPAERARVRNALPEVFVPEWPADKLLYEKALTELTCFDSRSISDEDRARSRMYAAERRRTALQATAQTIEDYLEALALRVTAEPLSPSNLVRATQLLNKTNQMNLSTRRMTDADFLQWALPSPRCAYVFRVVDRFDDYGLTGVASLSIDGECAHIVDFVLSCRVMGRGVEQVMLHTLIEHARSLHATRLLATYGPTSRNAPCKSFFDERSAFATLDDQAGWAWDLSRPYAVPKWVAVETDEYKLAVHHYKPAAHHA